MAKKDRSEKENELLRYAHLSGFVMRTDAEEAEAQALHEKYKDETGWILHPREGNLK